ncbi:hypothetical protein P152DRAFT_450785 [Eremomyces bilateralis CBS 781.70]|uniref:Phospholipid metabolism enzyme regulator n=1 Tax=Eremomyces bilateralis CBS 781.70 TaxID=1392243 RepID=A0A6G1FYL6_9PEZI|nr:uncharacterized protein P152DRAFT_450785 [Eremomyces bilateralis CBS 781.70]KAF1810791.1 hypothetical protein P152DRAFT_450785 [Eremomyces bilateralis CBS 781.70]
MTPNPLVEPTAVAATSKQKNKDDDSIMPSSNPSTGPSPRPDGSPDRSESAPSTSVPPSIATSKPPTSNPIPRSSAKPITAPSADSSRATTPRHQSPRSQRRKPEGSLDAPNLIVTSSTPPQVEEEDLDALKAKGSAQDPEASAMKGGAGRAASGARTLETVQEGSPPDEGAMVESITLQSPTDSMILYRSPPSQSELTDDRSARATESGSDSSSKTRKDRKPRQDDDPDRTPRPKAVRQKSSFTNLPATNTRAQEGPSKNMTVETETVASIPQAPLGGSTQDWIASGKNDNNGTIRVKPSLETIRPKKDRKRVVRKPPSVTSGPASSKADVFEAKVANAVDEADSSDSDETFVYESNPPEPQPRRSRHHSRTPSATSMVSLADPRSAIRSMGTVLDGQRAVPSKRSMKFTNNPYTSSGPEDDGADRPDGGTIRTTASRTGGSAHHHHISRGRGQGYGSILDDDNGPFLAHGTAKSRTATGINPTLSSHHSSRPSSPKYPHNGNGNRFRKLEGLGNSYDMDGEGDDERTPLVGTVRTPRSSRGMRTPGSNSRQPFGQEFRGSQHRRRSFASGMTVCVVVTIALLLVGFGGVGFLFATTKALYGVSVVEIQNVLATEQELMLDLLVEAVNPNFLGISISEMDVNIFAKSSYVGSERWWWDGREDDAGGRSGAERGSPPKGEIGIGTTAERRRRIQRSNAPLHPTDDSPLDPPLPTDPPSNTTQTMLLGRIFHFDSPLTFDGAPFSRQPHAAQGELRLMKPGNKTEAGGTERWERVIQHPFQLIVRGVLKYKLPLSGARVRAKVEGMLAVKGAKGDGGARVTP